MQNAKDVVKPLNQNKMKNLERIILPFAGIGAFELIKYLLS
jgi:hypothetical protein